MYKLRVNFIILFFFSFSFYSCVSPENNGSDEEKSEISFDFSLNDSGNSLTNTLNKSVVEDDEEIELEVSFLDTSDETEIAYTFKSAGKKTILLPLGNYLISSKLTREDGSEYFTPYKELDASEPGDVDVEIEFEPASNVVDIGLSQTSFSTDQSFTLDIKNSTFDIHCTTNGEKPSTESSKYDASTPINLSGEGTTKIWCMFEIGGREIFQSVTVSIEYDQLGNVVFSSTNDSTYPHLKRITLSHTDSSADIRYQLNGTGSILNYSGSPVLISDEGSTQITAWAERTGFDTSDNTSNTYTVSYPTLSDVNFSLSSGTFNGIQSLNLNMTNSNDSGATIFYSLDGSNYSTYSSTISLSPSQTHTVYAYATENYHTNSTTSSNSYVVNYGLAGVVGASPGDGTISSSVIDVTLSSTNTIYYTTDGSDPSTDTSGSSSSCSNPCAIQIVDNGTTTIKAFSYDNESLASSVQSFDYTVNYQTANTPTIKYSGSTITASSTEVPLNTTIVITSNNSNYGTLSYSVDGGSNVQDPFYVFNSTGTFSFSAFEDFSSSNSYALNDSNSNTKEFVVYNPLSGEFSFSEVDNSCADTDVSISYSGSEDTIYYTTDGSDPSYNFSVGAPNAGTLTYSGAFNISSNTTVKAIAVASGYYYAPQDSYSATIDTITSAPTESPSTGYTFTSAGTITINPPAGTPASYVIEGNSCVSPCDPHSGSPGTLSTNAPYTTSSGTGYGQIRMRARVSHSGCTSPWRNITYDVDTF